MFDRRDFLRSLAGLTAGLAVGRSSGFAQPAAGDAPATGDAPLPEAALPEAALPGVALPGASDRLGKLLPMRRLGRTGQWVTALGFGGSHIVGGAHVEKPVETDPQAQALIEAALEEGVRFFDNAQQYGNGEAERRFGRLLTPKYRDVIYLMSKTQSRDARGARRDMDECRQRMKVDVIDLMQIHHIESAKEVDRLVDNGVVDVLLEAREQGKIRHLGFTGHNTPHAHLRMLERLEQLGVDFDTVQMPMNVVDPHYESFIVNVLPKLIEKDYGVLAMKTLAFGQLTGVDNGWARRDRLAPEVVPQRMSLAEALGFVWSLPISTLISGMVAVPMVWENAAAARAHVDLDDQQRRALIDKVAEFAGPRTEFYKTEV